MGSSSASSVSSVSSVSSASSASFAKGSAKGSAIGPAGSSGSASSASSSSSSSSSSSASKKSESKSDGAPEDVPKFVKIPETWYDHTPNVQHVESAKQGGTKSNKIKIAPHTPRKIKAEIATAIDQEKAAKLSSQAVLSVGRLMQAHQQEKSTKPIVTEEFRDRLAKVVSDQATVSMSRSPDISRSMTKIFGSRKQYKMAAELHEAKTGTKVKDLDFAFEEANSTSEQQYEKAMVSLKEKLVAAKEEADGEADGDGEEAKLKVKLEAKKRGKRGTVPVDAAKK